MPLNNTTMEYDPTSTGDSFSDTLQQAQISSLDLEDLLIDSQGINKNGAYGLTDLSINAGGTAVNNYTWLGSLVKLDSAQKYIDRVLDESYRNMGFGSNSNILQNFMSRLDRHGTALVPPNTLNYGFTFITRPRLNMTEGNLRQNPHFAGLETMDNNSVPFMIRGLLDTVLSTGRGPFKDSEEVFKFADLAASSPLLDTKSPFLIPLCNGLKGISGWPDFTVESETTEGDFHSGDFTFAQGSDFLNKSTELSLEFRDIQGGIVIAILYYWILSIACLTKGTMMAYPDDIYEQRLNYTVSIYRFVTDPTRRHVLWWAKATGCFPKSVPIGALFNINQGEVSISSASNFSVPFVANKIEYNHPGILMDFVRLVRRYNPSLPGIRLKSTTDIPHLTKTDMVEIPYMRDGQISYDIRRMNFMGVPFIVPTKAGIELKWYTDERYCDDPDELNEIKRLNKLESGEKMAYTKKADTEIDKLYKQVIKERNERMASIQQSLIEAASY